jgi:hypothetical protein
LWRIATLVGGAVRTATADPRMTASIGAAAAVVAIGVHGLLDSFLSFTPTYVLIALTLAMARASADPATVETHADRV